ncbi:hypothetical protein EVB81_029 [Rhizobium phage RHph_I46]|uniref:Uncharacterized protein n=1 Tax=Rhizobium phage RHph_I1_9 TaxID=2509729 RepID=A0A7S5R991_9CAUD|nr:hypothetical protein PP936_gp029 [Rhizobium phage RHph_I1_9]QIG69598.1 hypothetical protein EVB81_029 [Rhizobium phage RHph_I46]QIG70879.1 hypothetical protein EVB92_029 [Rhizobium phage RHph_I9]QIG73466.1 hypothetical protein EVC04_029 [Rhizobium phage RHph_I1_9]QIG76218.1 hypothetical protein EVC25_029 [Rhizobium phage RHph_I34]
MRCQFIGGSKLRIFLRLRDFIPILDCNFPPAMVHPDLWSFLGEKLAIRFDIEDDPSQLILDIVEDCNTQLDSSQIEMIYIGNDNSREEPCQPRLQ